ncbi:MAG: hypothetical protein GFH27_549279n432 [Chloroflexi bacterium AL-W]|nr:hypothetical protein [Chloroflexi bacterium AL-N1]NOK65398.1 hypothetical protein [Chloroflexi bacterium AL-N10]NOK72336.1 hypothetical protein [Chloroflexi bacterium AL-N5]NOK79577.1 hypothetical protein [Chloroflexi bacterium AL-W]NOK87493.1 hypothetical protein [Chloroflexi bacterium AL-N15]
MDGYIVRIIVLLVFAGLLGLQVRAARNLPHRRRAFGMAAAALLVFAGHTLLEANGGAAGALGTALMIINFVLLGGALVSYILSARHGEMYRQYEQFAAGMKHYRKRRQGEKEES